MIQKFEEFVSINEDKNVTDILDDLKSNFRSYESDCDNKEDTEDLTNKLEQRYPKVKREVLFKHAKDWTGYEE